MLLKILLKVAFVVAASVLAWFSVPVAIVAICAIVLAALSDHTSFLIELSFGPLKAKLERDVTQAEKLLEQLKSFATLQAKASISTSSRTGRWADYEPWNYYLAVEIENSLRSMGVAEDEISDALQDFVSFTIRDFKWAILGGSYGPVDLGPDAMKGYNEGNRTDEFLDPDKLEAWLKEWDQLTPDRIERLADMRWIVSNRKVRDLEQYSRCRKAVPWKEGQV
ncbi:MAG: hypothetical protein WBL74_05620 [Novosphingobium sp.]|uniref:hypothetical protein n=1 Tax=Novosphingobium sp. TaxID=1874826 RepID=UPI003C7DCAC9